MLVGKVFGALTVIDRAGLKKSYSLSKYLSPHYLCECACGRQIIVSEPCLEYNIIKDCGCNHYHKKLKNNYSS